MLRSSDKNFDTAASCGNNNNNNNNDGLQEDMNILSSRSHNCLPPRFHNQQTNTGNNGRRAKCLPLLLLSLILYGLISVIIDVTNSVQHAVHKSRKDKQIQIAELRFPGGFHSDGNSIQAIRMTNSAQYDIQSQSTSMNFSHSFVEDGNYNYPTMEDVPALTEQVLSTTFQNALELESSEIQSNEIQFFWSIGGTLGRGPIGRFPAEIEKCFPNIVQAGGGGGGKGLPEEELRSFPNELRILQQKVPILGDDLKGPTRNGARYVNVDLFTSDGIRRAADLQMLFPTKPYPVVYEHDIHNHTSNLSAALERSLINTTESEDIGGEGVNSNIMASSQIQFIVSNFLPESMGLFAPPASWNNNNADVPPPKARIHALLPPTTMRINLYYQHYKSKHLLGTSYLQFVTSPSIVVDNYITRILSGQWDAGSPVTEVHLEVAKNVLSQKIHLWPIQGKKDLVLNWVERYGWQEGAMRIHQNLVTKFGEGAKDLVLGMDCMFPTPKPEGEQPARPARAEPTELEIEINNIIAERNKLDDILFHYAVGLNKAWVESKQ